MEWISIKDKLPPKDGTRFIIHKPKYTRDDKRDGYEFTAVVFYRWDDVIDPEYLGDIDDANETDYVQEPRLLTAWSHKDIGINFTLWMPLPEPPKETDNG